MKSFRRLVLSRPSPAALVAFGLLAACSVLATGAQAETVKPRFVILVDTSGSMAQNVAQTATHGDGSREHPGCDIDGNGLYDDSKMFGAKASLRDTLLAFGSAEFSLARYRQTTLGQTCGSTGACSQMGLGANVCVGGRCGFSISNNSPDYNECRNGPGCVRCADPDGDPTHVFYNGSACCPAGSPTSQGAGLAGDVVVPFPGAGSSNLAGLESWIDNREDFPQGTNQELRASGTTPIGGALHAVRDWLVNDASTVGPGAGVVNRDDRASCRSYNVILITDGLEVDQCVNNCRIAAARAADLLFNSCTNDGIWNASLRRCEIAGEPFGTQRVKVRTYVVGFTVDDPRLNAIAASGGTGSALIANDQAELTARLGDIIAGSIPTETCDCQDNTCDGAIDETFRQKGEACSIGVGRCKRSGRWGCSADGKGLVCTAGASGVCPATALSAGAPMLEACGAAPGCEAPTAEDCADDDCDGVADENMSCACAAKPESCNGLDDDCNGKIDDLVSQRCGLEIGECRPGVTSCVDDGAGGRRSVCMGGTQPVPELCDGKDNDCDGIVDGFGVACFPSGTPGCTLDSAPLTCGGSSTARWTCTGACETGIATCSAGVCGPCTGSVTPATELACDGIDNDCDGQIDEGFGIGESCGPGLGKPLPCRAGVRACAGGVLRCEGGAGPADEICNGADDDCDAQIDNLPGACGAVRGECRPGRYRCERDVAVCEQTAGPLPELCDGKDNDCDGETDESPLDPELQTPTACGSEVGSCRPGILRCVGGGKFCEGGTEPIAEACNGADDDCDGTTDEGVNPPGPCPAPDLPLGTPIRGECRPGANTCIADSGGARFACRGGVGPAAEICDGKDNDCDGQIDDQAPCPDGQGCADDECVARCGQTGDPDCSSNRLCQAGLCRFVACVRTPCAAGFRCDPKRGCVDRCEGVSCPAQSRCDNGECTSCLLRGCPEGQICRRTSASASGIAEDTCVAHPCTGKTCGAGQYCRDGACVRGCTGVSCDDGQTCRDGDCVPDACTGRRCGPGETCDGKDGVCRPDPCASITCLRGLACVPGQSTCTADPCAVTVCAAGQTCLVRPDGLADCRVAREISAGGSGCACELGSRGRDSEGTLAFVVIGLGIALARRRRR